MLYASGMSDAVLDRGFYYPSPMTDRIRERPFKVAFAASLLIHAALIALVPGFRAVIIEPPKVLNVEIVLPEQPQLWPMPLREVVPPTPITVPAPPQRSVEEAPVRPEQQTAPRPEPVMRQPEPEPPPMSRADIVLPLSRPEPPPVARAEPRPEPRPVPAVESRPEPRRDPLPEVRSEPQPVAQMEPPPIPAPQARIEPATPVVQPLPVEAAAVQPAPAPAPAQPVALKEQARVPAAEPGLLLIYGQSISREIRRHQKYPPLAQLRGWEGTAEVQLQIAADGKVTRITLAKSSGRSILDEEALNMVRRASPLPESPQNLRGRELTVTVPIAFKLQES